MISLIQVIRLQVVGATLLVLVAQGLSALSPPDKFVGPSLSFEAKDEILDVFLSPRGTLAAVPIDYSMEIWHIRSRKRFAQLPHPAMRLAVFSDSEKLVAMSGAEWEELDAIRLYEVSDKKVELRKTIFPKIRLDSKRVKDSVWWGEMPRRLHFSDDGKYLFALVRNGLLRRWEIDPPTYKEMELCLPGCEDASKQIYARIELVGDRLILFKKGEIEIWRYQEMKPKRLMSIEGAFDVNYCWFSPHCDTFVGWDAKNKWREILDLKGEKPETVDQILSDGLGEGRTLITPDRSMLINGGGYDLLVYPRTQQKRKEFGLGLRQSYIRVPMEDNSATPRYLTEDGKSIYFVNGRNLWILPVANLPEHLSRMRGYEKK